MTSSITDLISGLSIASQQTDRKGKSYKTQFVIQNTLGEDVHIDSWKFNEWDYGKEQKIKLPCNARGLFTSTDNEGTDVIVARGYDKFFNVNELQFTTWESIENNTTGPYEISQKENGCIIFITGLQDGTLVVCSKHSVGVRNDVNKNHAIAGELFLRKQLNNDEGTLKKLAKQLYEMKCTAVAEYCDDSFEEHVLEYSKNKAGLYLHGLNKNNVQFETLSMNKVNEFAEAWGFQKIEYFVQDDIASVRAFVEECGKTGCYNNNEIEGFVIRSHLKSNNAAFFFKYKFEEPYLMYRQWREVTKEYITSGQRVFKFRKNKFITNQYMDFVVPLLASDPQLSADYLNGFGIIKLRKMFLDSCGMSGMEMLIMEKIKELEEQGMDHGKIDSDTKFLLVPISTIGCGKTTVALTLTSLFPETFGHIQNDDITGKDKAQLIKRSLELLKSKKCVIVDRNNHQYFHRKQIFEWLNEYKEEFLPYDTNVQVVAVPFFQQKDIDTVSKITTDRVLNRGDNHQTIKLSSEGEKKVLGIMNGFISHYQALNTDKLPDSQFDRVIEGIAVRENTESSLENSKVIVAALHENYPLLVPTVPSAEEFSSAFSSALAYKPPVKTVKPKQDKKKKNQTKANSVKKEPKRSAVYFGLSITDKHKVEALVKKCILKSSDMNAQKAFKRFLTDFHVTLCHVASLKNTDEARTAYAEYMKMYEAEYSEDPKKGQAYLLSKKYKVVPTEIIWNGHIMTLLVKIVDPTIRCFNKCPHISISLLDNLVKPFYSNQLAESYLYQTTDEGTISSVSIDEDVDFDSQLCAYF